MSNFWIGFIIAAPIGTIVGFLAAAMFTAGGRDEQTKPHREHDPDEGYE